MPLVDTRVKDIINDALANRNLTLYLGAGVSVGSGLPTWEKLVLAMYFSVISEQKLQGWKPFPNYLYAIAEWQLKNNPEPLEITARKLRKFFGDDDAGQEEFLRKMYKTLYGGFLDEYEEPVDGVIDPGSLRYDNETLDSVVRLFSSNNSINSGVKSVITYNYDDLLEIALNDIDHQSVYRECKLNMKQLPVFHVHGYVPFRQNVQGSAPWEIVFTEDQYHRVADDPYYWSNLIQIQAMSNSIGLMIGLSLSDRNMRRLLDAVGSAPINNQNFAILIRPSEKPPDPGVLDEIHEKAKEYFNKFPGSKIKSSIDQVNNVMVPNPGIKSDQPVFSTMTGIKGPSYQHQIAGILGEVKKLDLGQQEFVLKQLGITPIWFDSFNEIPQIIDEILN